MGYGAGWIGSSFGWLTNPLDNASSGTVTSVGISMPSAFTVTNSPITTSGTITISGAGTTSQYIRGDGSLANFPNNVGGGASVTFYLNGGTSQGTFGGTTYYQMSTTAVIGSGADFSISSDGYIASFITDLNQPNQLLIPSGSWNFQIYFSASASGGSPNFYVELYSYDGLSFTLISSSSLTPEYITGGVDIDLYSTSLAVPQTSLTNTDRLALRIYVNHSGRTITLHTQDGHLDQIITTFSTGITALNGLTAQIQTFATGTSGVDFNISSSVATHTFNLPTASSSSRGALSSSDWTTFNGKQDNLNGTGVVQSVSGVISYVAGSDNDFLQRKSGAWTNRTISQVYTDLQPSVLNDVYFTVPFFPATLSPADATTYYIGAGSIAPSTTATNQDISLPFDFTVIGAVIMASGNTASGTTENSTMSIRNTTTSTSSTMGTFQTNGSTTVIITTTLNGLSINVNANDLFCLQWLAPTWATNPTGVALRTILICKRR